MASLKQLTVLGAVGEAGSFSAAADRLDYTQPAVSKIVAGLERELGMTLVDRGIRPLRLTDAGAALTRRAEAALEQLAAGEAEVEAIRRLEGGTLRVATFSSAGARIVVPALTRFRAESPGVEVTIAERGMPSRAVRELRAGDLDLVVVFDYPDAGDLAGPDLDVHPLLDDRMDVVLPADHRLAGRKRVRFADLRREDWLLPDFGPTSPTLTLITRGCTAAEFEPAVAFRVNDCQLIQSLVAAGEGVAVLPRLMLHPPHPGIAVRPLAADAPIRRIVAVRLPARYMSPAAERFLELLRDAGAAAAEPVRSA